MAVVNSMAKWMGSFEDSHSIENVQLKTPREKTRSEEVLSMLKLLSQVHEWRTFKYFFAEAQIKRLQEEVRKLNLKEMLIVTTSMITGNG